MIKGIKDVQDLILFSEIAVTVEDTQSPLVCPICGKPSTSQSTSLCTEHFFQCMEEIEHVDDLVAWINREISIRRSFPKQFV